MAVQDTYCSEDEVADFLGRVPSLDQRLKFPQIYTPASDGTTIPRAVIAACCELALHLSHNYYENHTNTGV